MGGALENLDTDFIFAQFFQAIPQGSLDDEQQKRLKSCSTVERPTLCHTTGQAPAFVGAQVVARLEPQV